MPKVFISHSTQDRDFVEREIIPALHRAGIETWYSKMDIHASDRWERSIHQGLQDCDWFLLVMSPRSMQSEWVHDELHWAMDHRFGRIVPVLIEECDPCEFHIRLQRLQYIDFRKERDQARSALLNLWGVSLPPPNPPMPKAPPPPIPDPRSVAPPPERRGTDAAYNRNASQLAARMLAASERRGTEAAPPTKPPGRLTDVVPAALTRGRPGSIRIAPQRPRWVVGRVAAVSRRSLLSCAAWPRSSRRKSRDSRGGSLSDCQSLWAWHCS